MTSLYPEIVDNSTLAGIFNVDQFFTIGIEGQMDTAGSATVAVPQLVVSPADADTLFGPSSSLGLACKFALARGMNFVWASASKKGSAPVLNDRKTAWAPLEENTDIRIRITDSVTQADLVALADSCEYAELIQNKQFAITALATPSDKASLGTAAGAIASKRGCIVGPGVYDLNGTLLGGAYAALYAATKIARNADITDDLDGDVIEATAGIEKDTNGMPLFRLKANAGTPVNDFEDLLDLGVSPFRQGRNGQAEFTHMRMTYTVDDTYDALMTLLIKDQVFIDLRAMLLDQKFLRRGNTPDNQGLAKTMVERWFTAHDDWVQPITLQDGTIGYGVTVTASPDKRTMIVYYQGEIVRNNQKIELNGTLTIPA